MSAVFAGLIILSLLLAVASKRGHSNQPAEDFFVASGQFGTILFFFLAVGETYSVGTILGFPGGVIAKGTGFISWFLGYILLSFPVGYFLYPWIWRLGRRYGAVTLPDLFRRHFKSRGLEIVVALASIGFLIPLGVMQFIGLNTVFGDLGWSVPPMYLTAMGGGLAFTYIAISGIRAPAFVAVLKDVLIMAAILLTGLVCLGTPAAASHRGAASAIHIGATGNLFAMSTILLQAIGFCVVPQTCATVFTAQSLGTVRRAQVGMPLYMVMFPFLTVISYFSVSHNVKLSSPNDVFLAVARAVLPAWGAGIVMAGAALSALVVLTGICLAIGPLIMRNLVPGLSGDQQRRWSQLVMAIYLLLSIAGAARSSQLMVAINNVYYFGMTQAFPGVLAMLIAPGTRPAVVACGLITGDVVAIGLYGASIPLGGCNPGLIGLSLNLAIVFGVSLFKPKTRAQNAGGSGLAAASLSSD